MKSILFVLINIFIFSQIYCQKTPNIGGLNHLSGKIETYYPEGFKENAEYLQVLLEDAVCFYEKIIIDTLPLELLVLNRKTWKGFSEIPYPIPHYRSSEKRMIMPVDSYYKIVLHKGDSIYGKDHYYFTDFIAIHELGHCIASSQGARSHSKWAGEFFADFIQVAYMNEIIPGFELGDKPAKSFSILPLKYKKLENFMYAGIVNEVFYHVKFQELANQIYLKHGVDFILEYMEVYIQLNKDIEEGKYRNVDVTNEMIFQNSIENILSIEPEIFKKWDKGMRQTFHSWLYLFGLVIMIVVIRLTDTSYSIFHMQKLKTRKIHRIIGMPSIRILINFKNIEDRGLKLRLIQISLFRVINLILCTILILIIILVLLL